MVRGYKVFNSNWTCRGKQYTCPGKFEEDVEPEVCQEGMHFCKTLAYCFNYYRFDPQNRVAEVVAYGEVDENGEKYCTNKLEIVRELTWAEVLERANIGSGCSGIGNTGYCNYGDYNVGHHNDGDYNVGDYNAGDINVGDYNLGKGNLGDYNIGNYNTGDFNSGHDNTGHINSGSYNTGNYNTGSWNTGEWNLCDYSCGCFNTISPTVRMFDKPTDWTMGDWTTSPARKILMGMPAGYWVDFLNTANLSEQELGIHPEAEVTGGLLKKLPYRVSRQQWWVDLSEEDKKIVMSLPNFDKEIFRRTTGIDIDISWEWKDNG